MTNVVEDSNVKELPLFLVSVFIYSLEDVSYHVDHLLYSRP